MTCLPQAPTRLKVPKNRCSQQTQGSSVRRHGISLSFHLKPARFLSRNFTEGRKWDVSLLLLLMRDGVLYLRFSDLYLFSRDTNHFAIAPDGNRNSVAPMFGDRFGHSFPKCFFGFVCQKERRSLPLFHWFTLYFNKLLKRSGSSISIFPDSSMAIILGTSPELSKIAHESAKGL